MLLVAGVTVVVAYGGLCALMYRVQDGLVFPAPPPATPRLPVHRTPEGHVLVYRPGPPGAKVVVYFHGNGEQVAGADWLAGRFAERGLGFAAIEFPGYGDAPGAPSEPSILAATEAGLTHLTSALGVPRDRLILFGQSLGTGVAVALAAKGWGERVLLVSPYTSLPDVAAPAFWFLPVRALMRTRFDSAARAPEVKQPALVVHSTTDEVIPVALGKALHGKLPNARLALVERAPHNGIIDRPEAWAAIDAFLSAP